MPAPHIPARATLERGRSLVDPQNQEVDKHGDKHQRARGKHHGHSIRGIAGRVLMLEAASAAAAAAAAGRFAPPSTNARLAQDQQDWGTRC